MATRQSSTDGSTVTRLLNRLNTKRLVTAYFVLMAIYIYAPIISLLVFSFNTGGVTAPFAGFTLEAYESLFANGTMWSAISRSIQLALVVTVITTLLATATALAYRYDFWGQRGMLYLIILGIITPGITYGVGTLLLLTQVFQLNRGLMLAIPVHVVWTLPFAVIVLLAGFPPNLRENERAAQVMGASKLTSFRKVVLPQILPTVLGAAVFAFTLSYNEAERGLLLVGRETTMPIQVFSVASADRATPELFALGSVTTVFSTVLLLIAGWLVIRNTAN
ncbi:ABC transporter permease [Natrinema sp. LN54]|uniref:ABC transporter permease n=1 Tax=Natrinema sp. LN54 TaxID=3458705 RepID=UPI0040359536